MSIQASRESPLPPTTNHAYAQADRDSFFEEDLEDFEGCISIDCGRDFNLSGNGDFNADECRRSMVDKEVIHISVDPISLKQSSKPPVYNAKSRSSSTVKDTYMFPPLSPAKTKFLNSSHHGSANSSPRELMKNHKKWKNNQSPAPVPAPLTSRAMTNLARQRSASVSPFGVQQEYDQLAHVPRSKSFGEGRTSAPPDDFDMWSKRVAANRNENVLHNAADEVDMDDHNGLRYYEDEYQDKNNEVRTPRKNNRKETGPDDRVKSCGALCLFLPGFSNKAKPVRSPRKDEGEVQEVMRNVVSRTVSLEKFECGSWSSSAIMTDDGRDSDSMQLYFDLPLELIRSSDDPHSPVATAFVFDRKGVLKNSSTRSDQTRNSSESSRHVRFSTSNPASIPASPSCITPRLRKAREDFNAYLEAQGG